MSELPSTIKVDLEAVAGIPIISTLLDVVCRTTGMGFAAVARVTEDRWIACSVKDDIGFGLLPGGELKLETTICNEIRESHIAVVIDHVEKDDRFCAHPTPAMYGFQSYISFPIFLKNGEFFGTLCAIDPKPAKLDKPETIGMFRLFSDLIAFHLHAAEQLRSTETKLSDELKNAELREQFIAVLGHDLRTPLGAVSSSAQLLLRMPLNPDGMRLSTIIKDSSYRMRGLIDNVMDFARGRLGGGITLVLTKQTELEKVLTGVVDELRVIWPKRNIETSFDLKEPILCDDKRIAQLFANLLANALAHGKADSPVWVDAACRQGRFILKVKNLGNIISPAVMNQLFKPFSRIEAGHRQEGLGLGLYIASEIANAHAGKIEVSSTEEETSFILEIPAN